MNAIITIGVSCSGKTTWANEYALTNPSYYVISRDDIRRNIQQENGIFVGNSGVNWDKWNWKDEKLVTEHFWNRINHFIDWCNFVNAEPNIIVADTNLNQKFRHSLVDTLVTLGFSVEFKEFPIAIEDAWKRDAVRENGVGHSVIMKQYNQWLEYLRMGMPNNDHVVNIRHKIPAVISDIDGTIAHNNGKRSPYNWKEIHLDEPNGALRDLLWGMSAKKYDIIYVSGRDSICRDATQLWLNTHDFPLGLLYMRAQGDNRKDYIVKEELYLNHIQPKYHVVFVLDDRPQVIRNVWQKLCVPTLIVGNPWIEF
jgi:predicted kinase